MTEVRKSVLDIRQEIDQLQNAKDEIEELRDFVEKLDLQRRYRRVKSNRQVRELKLKNKYKHEFITNLLGDHSNILS